MAEARAAAERELESARATLAGRRREAAAAIVRRATVPEYLLRVGARVRELELVLEGLTDLAIAAQFFELAQAIARAEMERAYLLARIPDLDASLLEATVADAPLDPTGRHVDFDAADRRHVDARNALDHARSRASRLFDVIDTSRSRRAQLLRSHPFLREMDAATS